MTILRTPETLQTIYAELLDQTIRAEAEILSADVPSGTFVSKNIRNHTYWYLQRLDGGHRRQIYLGPESDSLLQWMRSLEERHLQQEPDVARREDLVSMLVAGGAAAESAAVSKVLEILRNSGVFRLGAVLVGTHAFTCYGNMLGVRFQQQTLRTADIDLAQDRRIALALDENHVSRNILEALRRADERFFAVPGLDPREPSTSFKVRGRDLRVDFLTPGREQKPVYLPLFQTAATALPHLDYLTTRTTQAVALASDGILVNVALPARYALHKIWTSGKRPVSERVKSRKDLRQAEQLIELLLEDDRGQLREAWRSAVDQRMISAIRKGLQSFEDNTKDRLFSLV